MHLYSRHSPSVELASQTAKGGAHVVKWVPVRDPLHHHFFGNGIHFVVMVRTATTMERIRSSRVALFHTSYVFSVCLCVCALRHDRDNHERRHPVVAQSTLFFVQDRFLPKIFFWGVF